MTKGHAKGEVVPFWFATEAIHGAGGLRSNVEDMLKYLKANVGPPKTDLERAMREAHKVRAPVQGDLSIGLGWQVQQYQGRTHRPARWRHRRLHHLHRLRSRQAGRRRDADQHDAIPRRRRAGLFAPRSAARDPGGQGRQEGTRNLRRRLRGSSGPLFSVRLEPEGWLTIRVPNNVRFRMYAQSDNAFFVKRAPWRFTFNKDASGQRASSWSAISTGPERGGEGQRVAISHQLINSSPLTVLNS